MKLGTLFHYVPGYKSCFRVIKFCQGTKLWSFEDEKKNGENYHQALKDHHEVLEQKLKNMRHLFGDLPLLLRSVYTISVSCISLKS